MITLILATMMAAPVQTNQVAQFQPCVWPNRCATSPAPVVAASGPFTTCQWPNKCG